MNIDLGLESILGILLKGLVLKDVHKPDLIKFSLIEEVSWLDKSIVLILMKDSSFSLSSSEPDLRFKN